MTKMCVRLLSIHYPEHWPQNGNHSYHPETTYTDKHKKLAGRTTVHTHEGIPCRSKKMLKLCEWLSDDLQEILLGEKSKVEKGR